MPMSITKLLPRSALHTYQRRAYSHVINNPYSSLLLDMGLGKTITTLTAVSDLLAGFEINKPLIIAPKLVTEQTWIAEIGKWAHLRGLTISRIIGTEQERIAATKVKADIYAVSRDNIAWLVEYYKRRWPYDMIVIDESSSFKSHTSKRFKAVKSVLGFCKRLVLLTGTPAPNGLLDLWSQIYLLDKGERLERTITAYRGRYFQAIQKDGYTKSYELWPGSKEAIFNKISDLCISMKASDWLDLLPRQDIVTRLVLDDMVRYKKFFKQKVLELKDRDITSKNAGGLYNKLLQFCNGAVYDEDGNYHIINNTKLDELEEDIEALQGKPVIVFYQFKFDLERIKKRFPQAVQLKGTKQIDDWNAGKIEIMVAHGASTGHGLNLQEGGYNLIWFGLPWSLEIYQQSVARVDRQGQVESVVNKILITKGTVEEMVWSKLQSKEFTQDELILALKYEYKSKIAA